MELIIEKVNKKLFFNILFKKITKIKIKIKKKH